MKFLSVSRLLAVGSLLALAPSAQAAFSGENGKIAFRNANGPDIYVVNADGTRESNLTNDSANEWPPVWSPDGKKIAYQSDGDGMDNAFYIYGINADGTAKTRLTNGRYDGEPAWSPDGTKIAFMKVGWGNPADPRGTYVMNADGSDLRPLVSLDTPPVWSPDGTRIAFTDGRDIYVANADGSGLNQLTDTPVGLWSSQPVWSPDGAKVAFDRITPEPDWDSDAYVMNADGTGQTLLLRDTPTDAIVRVQDWGPSRKILVEDGQHVIYSISADGVEAPARVASPGSQPRWSPDGRRIVFTWEGVYVVNADGSTPVRVTSSGYDPDWQALVRGAFPSDSAFCRAQREAVGQRALKQRYGPSAFQSCIRQTRGS